MESPRPTPTSRPTPEPTVLPEPADEEPAPSATVGNAVENETSESFVDEGAVVKGELGAKLDRYLTQITPFGFSGALLVAKDGEIVLNKGYGMAIRSEGVPNTSDTVFSTGSITKQFTAAAIMKLEMQGRLDTQDLVSKYLAGVPQDKAGLTLHNLLTHTAGVIEFTDHDYEPDLRDETVKTILDAPLKYTPGEQFLYSNAGYTLLTAIVEKVSGRPYEEFLRQELFEPAGMRFTGYRMPDWEEKVVAHWYRGSIDNGTPLEKPYPFWNLIGNGGILSTTKDMYKWHLALLGDKVLPPEARAKLFTPYLNKYAYGWDVLPTEHGTLIQHNGGSTLGNSAEVLRYVDADVTIVLFANQSYLRGPLSGFVIQNVKAIVFGEEVEVPPDVSAGDLAALLEFKGAYRLPTGGRLTASVDGDFLTLAAEGQDGINLLTAPDEDALSLYDELNDRSATIMRAIVDGDYIPLEEALAAKRQDVYQHRPSAYDLRGFIDRILRRGRGITGELQNVVAQGTVRSAERKDVAETTVELRGTQGSIYFRLHWRKGEIIGLEPAESGRAVEVRFLPLSEHELAGYHLGIAKNVRITFKLDNDGAVHGLTVHGQTSNVDATRG